VHHGSLSAVDKTELTRTKSIRSLPVQTYDEQIHDRCIACCVVNREPSFAHRHAQSPGIFDIVSYENVHGKDADGKVTDSQAQNHIIAEISQAFVYDEGQNDNRVPTNCQQAAYSCRHAHHHNDGKTMRAGSSVCVCETIWSCFIEKHGCAGNFARVQRCFRHPDFFAWFQFVIENIRYIISILYAKQRVSW